MSLFFSFVSRSFPIFIFFSLVSMVLRWMLHYTVVRYHSTSLSSFHLPEIQPDAERARPGFCTYYVLRSALEFAAHDLEPRVL